MTNDYTPKPGDSVKATLGENVLYGTVDEITSQTVRLDVADDAYAVELDAIAWHIEPWVKPITFKPLTVVGIRAGAVISFPDETYTFERSEFIYRNYYGYWWGNTRSTVEEWGLDDEIPALLASGDAEILFDGVEA